MDFKGYSLYDPGAYPDPTLSGKITWRVTQPWVEPPEEKELEAVKKYKELMERLNARSKKESGKDYLSTENVEPNLQKPIADTCYVWHEFQT